MKGRRREPDTLRTSTFLVRYSIFSCLLAVLVGCAAEEPPFRLNTEGPALEEISAAQSELIESLMGRIFGTPDEPAVPDSEVRRPEVEAGLRVDRLQSATGLYRQHCAACHGISGDGSGPTAAVQYPYPRDLRRGLYKYTSTDRGMKPFLGDGRQMGDLERIVRNGIPATAMPRFDRLADAQIDALVEYVRYLSIRGETEAWLLQEVVVGDELSIRRSMVLEDAVEPTASLWAIAQEMVLPAAAAEQHAPLSDTSEALAASIERGYEHYSGKNAQCKLCHGLEGRGDGEQTELYDEWNRPKKGATPEQTARLAGRFLLPIQELRPRDFTEGIFRGGDRPIDLYWRVYVGIKGTPMPSTGSDGALTPEQIWDVVNYIRSRSDGGP
ncbi:MAG: cytochrome c [Candidatus Nealsonbacteria bacterium]|nr:cytochrome c [Candidatus Nealsonbacteria bacterium]